MDLAAGFKQPKTGERRSGRAQGAFFVVVGVFGSAAVALGLFVAYVNEGRDNPIKLPGAAVLVDSSSLQPWGMDGRLVGISGIPQVDEPVGDGMYLVPGQYLEVRRELEVYAWHETSGIRTVPETIAGAEGKATRMILKKVYEYDRKWSANPHDSLGFGEPDGHENPPIHVEKGMSRPHEIRVGRFVVPARNLVMPAGADLELTDGNIDLWDEQLQEPYGRRVGNMIYAGKADPENPQVGDVRIHYEVVLAGRKATFYGSLSDGRLVPFEDSGPGAFRLEWGGLDESLFEANRRFVQGVWANRAAAAALVLIGMLLMVGITLTKRRLLAALSLTLIAALVCTAAVMVVSRMTRSLAVPAAAAVLTWITAFIIGRRQEETPAGRKKRNA